MRSMLLVCTIGLIGLSGGLGLLAAPPEHALEGFDPYRPATLLPIVAAGFREVHPLVRSWVDTAFVEPRDVLQRTTLRESLP